MGDSFGRIGPKVFSKRLIFASLMWMFIPSSGSSSDDGFLPPDPGWPLCWPSQEGRSPALYWNPCWAFTEGILSGTLLSASVKFCYFFFCLRVNVYLCFHRNGYTGNRWSWCCKPMSSLCLTRPWVTFEPGCADLPAHSFRCLYLKKTKTKGTCQCCCFCFVFLVVLAVALFQPAAFPQRGSAAKCCGAGQTQPHWEPRDAHQSRSRHCSADTDQQSGTRFEFKKTNKKQLRYKQISADDSAVKLFALLPHVAQWVKFFTLLLI